jgi:hypothetical protein
VARFLSREWFDELQVTRRDNHERPVGAGPGPVGAAALVIDVVVSGAPEGEVRYQLVVDGERPTILSHKASFRPAQLKLSSDYATMAGIASGRLSALEVLSGGRARLSGDIGLLSSRQSAFGGLDLLPLPVRATTTF